MKKRILSFLLAIGMIFTAVSFGSCGGKDSDNSSSATDESVDYAAQVTLDMNSETKKQEVTVENHIDGDTTHFKVPTSIVETGILKARYLAVNTPESTDQIEEWGKKASAYTKERVLNATSIIIETDGDDWAVDSTGKRYLVWVWYKLDGMTDYRCLNIELLQEGLAVGSKASSTRYGDICVKAIDQATLLKLNIHSGEKDPDFYYLDAQPITLKELRLNVEKYVNTRVVFEGTVVQYSNNSVFVQDYDEETNLYYGVQVYYGFGLNPLGEKILTVGNRVRIAGNFEYSDLVQMYQVCDLEYDPFKESVENLKLIESNQEIVYTQIFPQSYVGKKTITTTETNEDGDEIEVSKEYDYAKLIMHTAVSMKSLKVKKVYTTANGGSNDGAITLTCEADGEEIIVRTTVLKDENGNVVTEDYFKGKTIDVKAIVDSYNDECQLKVFLLSNVTVH